MLGLCASKGSLIDENKLTKVQRARVSWVKNYRRERELQPWQWWVGLEGCEPEEKKARCAGFFGTQMVLKFRRINAQKLRSKLTTTWRENRRLMMVNSSQIWPNRNWGWNLEESTSRWSQNNKDLPTRRLRQWVFFNPRVQGVWCSPMEIGNGAVWAGRCR